MFWLCVHFPALALENFARASSRPLETAPAVIVEAERVVQRNAAAERAGIRLGSTLATAQSLCHSLAFQVRDSNGERRRLKFLADAAYRFSSLVSVLEPSHVLLEVEGSLALFGGVYRLKRRLKQLFAELGHQTSLGLAHTPAASVVLARAGKTGCTSAWPTVATLVRDSLEALDDIELRFTECDAGLIERLSNMGITRLGQLFRLPAVELGRRFGPDFVGDLARLTGKRADPRIGITPSPEFRTSIHLLEAITQRETLAFSMQRLIGDLVGWLTSRQLGVTRLRWTFAAFGGNPVVLEVDLAEPQRSRKTLLALSRLRLERSELPDEILTIGLEALSFAAWQGPSGSLLNETAALDVTPAQLLDQLKVRLGTSACRGLETVDDHRPEHAWRDTPPDPHPGKNRRDGALRKQPGSPLRPLWLLEKPRPVPRAQLRLLQGPERIETGWWDTEPSRAAANRDYYVARWVDEFPNRGPCWVFTDRRDGQWYLHGYFG